MKHAVRIFAIVLWCSALSACFLEVMVPRGGSVSSASSSRDCPESMNCANEILDATFNDSFKASPNEGFVFSRWQGGDDFLCPNSTNPVCEVSNTILAGNTAAEAAIAASFRTWYIMPVFEFVGIDTDGDGVKDHLDDDDDNDTVLDVDDGCPLDGTRTWSCDTVFVDGTEWAQAELFYGVSWNEINTVCPGGTCIDSGMLADFDMTGWHWASVEEMNTLFNGYIDPVTPTLGPGADGYSVLNSSSAPAFFADGWEGRLQTSPGNQTVIGGITSTSVAGDSTRGYLASVIDNAATNGVDSMYTNGSALKVNSSSTVGAWFYRGP